MERLELEKTTNTPLVVLDPTKHHIEIKGDSRPEDSQRFYEPIFNWLENYKSEIENKDDVQVRCYFGLEYFNSVSAKYLFDFFSMLKQIESLDGVNLDVEWHYDERDEDLLDSIHEYSEMSGVNITPVAS